jgi:hypothetical protein
MRVYFEFDVADGGLASTHFARLFCDIQHLITTTFALVNTEIGSHDAAFNPWLQSYKGMVEARGEALGYSEVFVVGMSLASPLKIEVSLPKIPASLKGQLARAIRFVVNRVLFIDLERKKRELEIHRTRQELEGARLKNLSSAFDLAERIPDPALRRRFLESM